MVLLGRAWQHFLWQIPYQVLIVGTPVKSLVELVWGKEITHWMLQPEFDTMMTHLQLFLGIIYVLAILILALPRISLKIRTGMALFAAFLLILYSLVTWVEQHFRFGMFMEHCAQIACPILLFLIWQKYPISTLRFWLKSAVTLTFVGHGLYAIGWYPQPGYFIDLIILWIGISESSAHKFLQIAGILDLLLAAGIWLPWQSIQMISISWAIFWGLLTTIARFVFVFYDASILSGFLNYAFEVLVRTPHWVLPLVLFRLIQITVINEKKIMQPFQKP